MDWEDAVNEGIEARKQGDAARWTLGDLAGGVEKAYGEAKLKHYADSIGISYGTLRRYRWVAQAFAGADKSSVDKSVRRQTLSFSHHEAVAGRENRVNWLVRAEAEGWNVSRLRGEVAASDRRPTGDERRGEHAALTAEIIEAIARYESETLSIFRDDPDMTFARLAEQPGCEWLQDRQKFDGMRWCDVLDADLWAYRYYGPEVWVAHAPFLHVALALAEEQSA